MITEGAVAKWLGTGLQIHEHRFESDPHLHFQQLDEEKKMAVPQDLFYAKTHEWVSLGEGIATVGTIAMLVRPETVIGRATSARCPR